MNHPYEMPDRAETLPPLPGDASAAGDSGLEALLPGSPPVLAYGTVLDEKTSSCDVILDDGSRIRARRADGCLLAPQPRDRVLVARKTDGESYVLAVLLKHNDAGRIVLPPATSIGAEKRLTLEAQEVTVQAGQRASLEGPEVVLSGGRGTVRFLNLLLSSLNLQVRLKRASAFAQTVDTVMGRLTQRANNVFREVDNLEQLSAGRITTTVRERFALRSRRTTLRSDEDTSIDGKSIHLG